MGIFYVLGGVLAGWALLVSFLGVMREGFPATAGAERAVAAVSVVLVIAAISSAIIAAANEEHGGGHEEDGHSEEAALVR